MMKSTIIVCVAIILVIISSFTLLKVDNVTDYLSAGKKLIFEKEEYRLQWSSNPSPNYYKQEYLRSGDSLNSFKKMLLVEAIKGNLTVNDAVVAKIQELEERKKTNPVINYQRFDNEETKESMIDFVVSDQAHIYEWNVYRFKQQKHNKGNCIVLFAYCHRDSLNTNDDLKEFFGKLKEHRFDMINKVGSFSIPELSIKE